MTTDETTYAEARTNRLLAAEMFAGLDDEQWRTPSLCAGWTVREVAGHLVPPEDGLALRRLLPLVVRHRGNLGRMVDATAREAARRPTDEIVAALRERAGARLSAPVVGPAGPMVDTAIHLRDAPRPLGLGVTPSLESWRLVLDFLRSRAARGVVPRGRLDGIRLECTDQDWAGGDGAVVRGTSEGVALAVAGRGVVLTELEGAGVAVLADRLGC